MKAVPSTTDEPGMPLATMRSARKRYSREFVLSRKEISANMKFPVLSIPTKAPRGARKVSQSNDQKGHKTQEGSREDLNTEELEGSHAWHRVGRGQWNAGNPHHQQPFQPPNHAPSHPRPRYPSGSHGDADPFISNMMNAPLRPAPDTRRGGHGDWSRGCAGWRQRSYSGSERSGTIIGQHPRGRGTGMPFGVENDDSHARGRGRGRGFVSGSGGGGRFAFPHRGGGPGRGMQSSAVGAHRPSSSGSVHPQTEESEEFWQEEDWDSAGLESPGSGTKSRERLNSFTHKDLPPVAEQTCPPTESEQLIRGMTNLRVYSKSCSLEPPPGFSIPSLPEQSSSDVPATTSTPPVSSVSRPMVEPTLSTTSSTKVIESSTSMPPQQPSSTLGSAAPGFKWLYVDSSGQIQGPFSNAQMSGWMAAGFLPLGIELRRDCDECFLTLADHINLAGRVPFWDGYSLKPITRASAAALAQTLANSSGHALGKPKWISGGNTEGAPATPASSAATTTLAPPFTTPVVGGASTTLNSKTAVAAAAAATAVLFATQAARMAAPVRPQPVQQHTSFPVIPSTQVTPDLPSVVSVPGAATGLPSLPLSPAQVPIDLVNGSQEFMRLYTEAQALAAHAAKVEAERKELVEKLAVINSTAAKLLGSAPDFASVKSTEAMPVTGEMSAPSTPGWETSQLALQTTTNKPLEMESISPEKEAQLEHAIEPDRQRTTSPGSSDEQPPVSQTNERRPDEEPIASSPDLNGGYVSAEPHSSTDVAVPDAQNDSGTASGDGIAKKSGKKKNKKAKKNKLTAEQERQRAWDLEFERRKQAALERRLAEEAEARRLAEEEAAALAEEQAALAQEQARALMEQRKREALRSKVDSQLGQLRLPQSARWGTSAVSSTQVPLDSQTGPNSLLSIQAAQALEEAEQKRREALMAEQIAVQLAAAEASATTKRPQVWAAVVNSDPKPAKPVGKTSAVRSTIVAGSGSTQVISSKTEFPTLKGQGSAERSKPDSAGVRTNHGPKTATSHPIATTGTTKPASSSATVVTPSAPSTSGTSIWDLPSDGKIDSAAGKPSKKQKKKHANLSHEAATFAAKEELAHWCESQLSSMPLSGVDLPTLVDLLCELEAADQVVEFIESSLGRSKRISKFSKAFLEKRAFILNTVP